MRTLKAASLWVVAFYATAYSYLFLGLNRPGAATTTALVAVVAMALMVRVTLREPPRTPPDGGPGWRPRGSGRLGQAGRRRSTRR